MKKSLIFSVLICLLLAGNLLATEPAQVALETRPDGAIRLTDPPPDASDQNPAFSPDGTHLLFTRFENGYNQGPSAIYLFNRAAGNISLLTTVPDSDSVNLPGSSWNAAAGRIAFASDREDADEIWTMAADGSDPFRVTHHTQPGYFIEPSFSPDGQWIVFEASTGAPEAQQQGSIWKVRAGGSGLTQLTDGPGDGTDDRQPNWSPAGDRILFQRRLPGHDDWNLYTMAPNGSDIRQITTTPSDDTDASWSPDGRWIVYSSDYGGLTAPNIFVISADGGEPIRITYDETHGDGAASWSPDGQWIAFESYVYQAEETPAALWLIAAPALELESVTPSVATFLYQLQDLDLEAIGQTGYDLIVMDYSATGPDQTAFSAGQIAALKNSSGGPKIVLAYLSIGEAETYRFYWQPAWDRDNNGQPDAGAPAWLDEVNPDWAGNYKVHYWDPGWQAIIYGNPGSYLDKIIAAGFDGVYLDLIDAYDDYQEQGRDSAAQEMVDFVIDLAGYARAQRPGFLIFPQNAAELAAHFPQYLAAVDGIGQEEIYYGYPDDGDPSPPDFLAEVEPELDRFVEAGKTVLLTAYTTDPAQIDEQYARARAQGYIPFATVRALDQLTINSGHEPENEGPRYPFPQHVRYASGAIRPNHRNQTELDNDVRAFYDYWKAKYLVAAGPTAQGNPLYRVSFGSSDPDRTVSEGQGYGMLIVALMAGYDPQAQVIFDGLWDFSRAHPSEIDGRLMDWDVPDRTTGNESAFDGDADIAYALLLADKQWGNAGRINYSAAARQVIQAIRESTLGPASRLPLFGDWVEVNGPTYNQYTLRTSDFMPAHFRAFGRATHDPVWDEVVKNLQAVISGLQSEFSPETGLLPDFIIPASTPGHTFQPAPPDFLEDENDGNYYYNAGRVPWRIGTDALLNNDPTSLAQVQIITHWAETAAAGNPAAIKAGYHLNGDPLPSSHDFTTFFAAPLGVAAMTEPAHQQWLNEIYDAVRTAHEDYYEDSVTLLCLLVMTGNYWDPTLP